MSCAIVVGRAPPPGSGSIKFRPLLLSTFDSQPCPTIQFWRWNSAAFSLWMETYYMDPSGFAGNSYRMSLTSRQHGVSLEPLMEPAPAPWSPPSSKSMPRLQFLSLSGAPPQTLTRPHDGGAAITFNRDSSRGYANRRLIREGSYGIPSRPDRRRNGYRSPDAYGTACPIFPRFS